MWPNIQKLMFISPTNHAALQDMSLSHTIHLKMLHCNADGVCFALHLAFITILMGVKCIISEINLLIKISLPLKL